MDNKIVLCISGDYRSGKSGISEKIAKHLDIPHYSMRKLYNKESLLNRDFVNWSNMINERDDDKIDSLITEYAINGSCVLGFRFAAILCDIGQIPYKGIWVTAEMSSRVLGNAFAWRKSKEETLSILTQREKKEEETSQRRYGTSYSNPKLYQYTVNLTEFWHPVQDAVKYGMKTDDLIVKLATQIVLEVENGNRCDYRRYVQGR